MRAFAFAFFLAATLGAIPADAGTLTYEFAGITQGTVFTAIPEGTPYSGTFTIDTSVAGQQNGQTVEFPQAIPPANFSISLAGLTIQSTGPGIVTLAGTNPAKFKFSMVADSFAGDGWSYSPAAGAHTRIVNYMAYPYVPIIDLNQLPLFTAPESQPYFEIVFGPGTYTYPGGEATIPGTPGRLIFSIATSLTLVPEPSTYALAATGVVALLAVRRRKARRLSRVAFQVAIIAAISPSALSCSAAPVAIRQAALLPEA